jgi:hypothetical protein
LCQPAAQWDLSNKLLLPCCCCCCHVQDVLVNTTGQRYIVLDMLGAGTFGQVVSSYSEAEGKQVAVKVGGLHF